MGAARSWKPKVARKPAPWGGPLGGGRNGLGYDADQALGARPVVLHGARLQREQGEVAAHADVGTGVNHRPDLANQDVSGQHVLAGVALDATALCLRVAAVLGATLTFFVCHGIPRLGGVDRGDLQRGERLAMTGLAAVRLAALVLEDGDLLAAALLDDLGIDRDPGDPRLSDAHVATVVGEQLRVERELRARVTLELFDPQCLALLDAILLSTSLNDGVHGTGALQAKRGSLGRRSLLSSATATEVQENRQSADFPELPRCCPQRCPNLE